MWHAVELMLRRALADPSDPDSVFMPRAEAESETPEPAQYAAKRRLSSRPPPIHRSSHPPPSAPDRVDQTWVSQIFANIQVEGSLAHARFGEYTLRTALQPVLSLAHHKPVGYEALLRAYDSQDRLVSPHRMFRKAGDDAIALDQICRALHVQNCVLQGAANNWIFLNVSPALILEGHSTRAILPRVLERYGVPAHRVVVEILETSAYDEENLARCVQYFRDLGCLVAIDDFGAGESNFERIWRLRPDLVKIDRAMIAEAEESAVVRRILPGLVSLLHEAGCLVVVEGIETAKQALIALGADVDFVQGYFFARPVVLGGSAAPSVDPVAVRRQFDSLILALKHGADEREAIDLDFFQCFTSGFESCLAAIEEGVPFFDACQTFLAVAGVQRAYLLDELGYQVGVNAESNRGLYVDPRLAPCADAAGSNWYRRTYFQAAIHAPGKVHISRPYLSVRDAQSCVTLSIAFESKEGMRVLCADLDHDPAEPISERSPRDSRILRR